MDERLVSIMFGEYAGIEAIKAEIESMKALNKYREMRGETIAYDEEAFLEKADALKEISRRMFLLFR